MQFIAVCGCILSLFVSAVYLLLLLGVGFDYLLVQFIDIYGYDL